MDEIAQRKGLWRRPRDRRATGAREVHRHLDELARMPADEVLARLAGRADGLTDEEAARRLRAYGPNVLIRRRATALPILGQQFKNPLLALLLAATLVSLTVGERTDALIILAIITLSLTLGFFDEYRADRAVRLLEERLTRTARVWRAGSPRRIPAEDVVPGDILQVEVGDIVPADARILEAVDLSVDEAALTGESLPVEKHAEPAPAPGELTSLLLAGSVIRGGRARAVVVATGAATLFGQVAAGAAGPPPATAIERGLRRFSLLLVQVSAVLTLFIFVVNTLLGRGLLEALLFALAIAVGLTPQLLPAIVTISLALGSRRLAAYKVIVRHLVAIEDLGDVEILFTDKTGTLTTGEIRLEEVTGPPHHSRGEGEVLAWAAAWLLAGAHPLAANPLDAVLAADSRVQAAAAERGAWQVRDELPFSYERRWAAVALVAPGGEGWVVVKGAAEEILRRCTSGQDWGPAWRPAAERALQAMLARGQRVLGVAVRPDDGRPLREQAQEGLALVGFLGFSDPPKPEATAALTRLASLGVAVKVLTGDHPAVALHVCERLGIPVAGVTTGAELEGKPPTDLAALLPGTTIFARVTPDQKAALVRAARQAGRDVGFLGDGVNDVPALHAADVGISVDNATDVAKAAADVVLLEKDLGVLADGILEGRRTFANTIKYILMATSSNFGNMFSAAGASAVLSFLPMLPTQILLNNFLYDVSELTIPSDSVDPELTRRPAHWDIGLIHRFMIVFGPVSSLYDFLTFALMLGPFRAGETRFHTGWFVESLGTQCLVIFALRTRRVPFWRSRPSTPLLVTTLAVVAVAVALPYSPLAGPLGFEPLPGAFLAALAGMVATYLLLVEGAKRWFFRRWPGLSG
jgi:Mg2+-importing ATPase